MNTKVVSGSRDQPEKLITSPVEGTDVTLVIRKPIPLDMQVTSLGL